MSADVRHRAEAAAVEVGLQARHLNGGLQNAEALVAGDQRGDCRLGIWCLGWCLWSWISQRMLNKSLPRNYIPLSE